MLMGSNDSQSPTVKSWVSDNFQRACFGVTNIRLGEYSNDCVAPGRAALFDLTFRNVGGAVNSRHQCWAAAW